MERQRAEARKPGSARARRRPSRSGSSSGKSSAPPSSSATTPHVAEGEITADLVDGAAVADAPRPATTSPIIVNQTPFYGESRRPGGRYRRDVPAPGGAFAVADTQKKLGDLFVHLGKVSRRLEVGDVGRSSTVDDARRAAHARQPFGHASAARGAAPAARRACHAEGLAGRARPAALRLQPSAPLSRRRIARRRGRGQRRDPRRTPRCRRG